MTTQADAYCTFVLITALICVWMRDEEKKNSPRQTTWNTFTLLLNAMACYTLYSPNVQSTHKIKWMSNFTLDLLSIWLTSFVHDFYIFDGICFTYARRTLYCVYCKQFSLLNIFSCTEFKTLYMVLFAPVLSMVCEWNEAQTHFVSHTINWLRINQFFKLQAVTK